MWCNVFVDNKHTEHLAMNIQVEQRNVYGQIKFYPFCPEGKQLAALMKQKTFDAQNIADIKRMGIDVSVTVKILPEFR
jgi:hypothetical protein